jgi:hypothetical protein
MSLQERRDLSDPRAMRALAHPLRLELLELLAREGSLTSTRAAELTGESTGSCSFHLRQLAKYGFIEEAEGGRGRERPWRPAGVDTTWSSLHDDSEGRAAAEALSSQLLRRDLDALDEYLRRRREYPLEWQDAGLMTTSLMFLTAEEFEALGAQILAVLEPYFDRTADPGRRPHDARPVRLATLAAPLPQ